MVGQTQININGYTKDDNVNIGDDLFDIAAGATLVLLGENILTDDAIEGAGRVSARGTETIDDGLSLSGSTLFVDMASVTQNGDLVLGQSPTDTATARNIAPATWTLEDGSTITSAGTSEFVNLGLLLLSVGDATIDANFYDRGGTIQADGTLSFDSPGDVNRFIDDKIIGSGTFEATGAVLVGSTISTSTVDLVDDRIVGNVTISSQNVNIDYLGFAPGADLQFTNPDATITLEQPKESSVGLAGSSGEIDIRGNDTVNATYIDYSQQTLSGGMSLHNFGDSTFSGNFGFDGVYKGFYLSLAGGSVVENEANATWTAVGENIFNSTFGQTATFINDGTFVANAANFDVDLVNNGAMKTQSDVGDDWFEMFRPVSGTGTIDVADDLTLIVLSSVGNGQTVAFSQSGGDLQIYNPQEFAASISGFADNTSNAIDVDDSWAFQGFSPDLGGGAGGSLLFLNGDSQASINLVGSFDQNGFTATHNNTSYLSVTQITYAPT